MFLSPSSRAGRGRRALEDLIASVVALAQPQARLSLTSGTAITTSDVSGATTMYYVPAPGQWVPLTKDGVNWEMVRISELSQATTDATKSPAAAGNNTIYDCLVWWDSAAAKVQCTRGYGWSSDTSRGTGAGTPEINFTTPFPTNKYAVTNGPAAGMGTLVGSARTDGSAQLQDTLTNRWVSNAYNAVPRAMRRVDTTDTWPYSTATYRQARGSALNQLDIVTCLTGSMAQARVGGNLYGDASGQIGAVGIDVDTVNTTAIVDNVVTTQFTTGAVEPIVTTAAYEGYPGLGRHTLIWKELGNGSGTQTWMGDNGGNYLQSGISGWLLN